MADEASAEKNVVECPTGTVLFREGEEGTAMYVIKSGRVELRKDVHETDIVVDELGAGAFCGELSLINEQRRPVTARVVEDAKLIQIAAKQFETMVRKNPDIALRMLKKMGQRLTESQFRLSNLVLRTPKARILRQLQREAQRVGDDDDLTSRAPIPDDLAEALAVEVGELKEQLNDLVRRELISVSDDGYFRILDPEAFNRYLRYLELHDRFEGAAE